MKPRCLNTGKKDSLCDCDECRHYNACERDILKEQERREKGEERKRELDNPARYSKYD